MQPKSIKKTATEKEIVVTWNNDHDSVFPFELLRNICPCASCQGEDILLYHRPPAPQVDDPKKYELRGIRQIGLYAIQVEWGDGHDAGIYTWEHLFQNCPCEECSKMKNK